MPLILFLFFVLVPILEIAVFIEAGRAIGWPATIIITLGTAFLGSYLVRSQGTLALNRFVQSAERGELPLEPVVDGMGILVAGVLLATPGFVTDTMGILLFVPHLRRAFVKAMFTRFMRGAHVHFRVYRENGGPKNSGNSWPPARPPQRGNKPHKSDNVIDADFETVEPKEGKGQGGNKRDGESSSPWKKD